jgi:SAM-dependent methyltransferase
MSNFSYQDAAAAAGGSYTENKLAKLALPDLRGKRFLDLGCNMGFYCRHALAHGATRVVGVDSDAKVIEAARKVSADIELFDGGWDHFPDGEFDVIVCLSAIHYARDPVQLVQQIRTHLSPGGLFVLEGGLIGVGKNFQTDLLIPAWRKVGDRCRHLSETFVQRHLLTSYKWRIIGPSEQRGGDDIPRYVIHANRSSAAPREITWRLDIMEYASCLALSGDTIVPKMPSFNYVRQLSDIATDMTPEEVARILSNENFDAFVNDLLFALAPIKPGMSVTIASNVEPQFLTRVAQRLRTDIVVHVEFGRPAR